MLVTDTSDMFVCLRLRERGFWGTITCSAWCSWRGHNMYSGGQETC